MKRILPWLLLPYLTFVQADNTDPTSQKNLLNQVSQEAGKTTLESANAKPSQTAGAKESKIAQDDEVDLDQLTQSVAVRLSELLGTSTKADAKGLPISLETVVSDALHDGKQIDEVRSAVAQAMADITGQSLQLDPSASNTVQENANQATATESSLSTNKKQSTTLTTEKTIKQAQSSKDEKGPSDPVIETQITATTATVLPGESLFRVAQRVYGEENGRRFLDIFAANRDIIKDINVVHEGQVLKLPEGLNDQPVATPTQ